MRKTEWDTTKKRHTIDGDKTKMFFFLFFGGGGEIKKSRRYRN